MTDALTDLAERAGIALRYKDVTQTLRETPRETLQAVLGAMGIAAATEAEIRDSAADLAADAKARALPLWRVITADAPARIDTGAADGPWQLALEDGTATGGVTAGHIALPALPPGYHRLRFDGAETLLLSAPARLPLPARSWGVTLPLYGLRTAEEGGFGDYEDLRHAVAGLGSGGASFVGINPVHAGFPNDPGAFSPYMPSSRQRLNTAHIAVPGAEGLTGLLIDYATDLPRKRAALRAAFAAEGDGAMRAAETYGAAGDAGLWRFATHQALSDRFGPYWTDWPRAYQNPDGPEVAAFAAAERPALLYHIWAQMRAADQLDTVCGAARASGMAHGLYLDLAVGTHPAGAETWADGTVFARKVSLGAPPDGFSPDGQTWGLAPFNPVALARTGFQALIDTLRAQFRFARLLRIDHILGFERAFWVPEGGLPGAYVTMPKAALLAIVRIEAQRAGATVIGEDLGNVPDGLRADLDASGILGCRVGLFEREDGPDPRYRPAEEIDENSLTSFSTHDLPTWRGWRRGRDIDWWERIGHMRPEAAASARTSRQTEVAAFDRAAGVVEGGLPGLNRYLGRCRARLVAVQIEDVLGLDEQPNLPGTVLEHPNWRRRLPAPACALGKTPEFAATARDVTRTDIGPVPQETSDIPA